MTHPADKWAAARFWLADHKAALGVPLAALVGAMLMMLLLFPFAPSQPVTGTVVGFGVEETPDFGTFPVAVVQLADAQTTVTLPRGSGCKAGDRIRLLRHRALLGWRFAPATPPCAAG